MTAFYVNIKLAGITSNKDTYFWKTINPEKGHPAKAAITPVNLVLQESQAEAVSLETPRREQWSRKQLPELLATFFCVKN